jgi:hypothetical protein
MRLRETIYAAGVGVASLVAADEDYSEVLVI